MSSSCGVLASSWRLRSLVLLVCRSSGGSPCAAGSSQESFACRCPGCCDRPPRFGRLVRGAERASGSSRALVAVAFLAGRGPGGFPVGLGSHVRGVLQALCGAGANEVGGEWERLKWRRRSARISWFMNASRSSLLMLIVWCAHAGGLGAWRVKCSFVGEDGVGAWSLVGLSPVDCRTRFVF